MPAAAIGRRGRRHARTKQTWGLSMYRAAGGRASPHHNESGPTTRAPALRIMAAGGQAKPHIGQGLEATRLEVGNGFANFLGRIHDEGAVPRHRLAKRATGNEDQAGALIRGQ